MLVLVLLLELGSRMIDPNSENSAVEAPTAAGLQGPSDSQQSDYNNHAITTESDIENKVHTNTKLLNLASSKPLSDFLQGLDEYSPTFPEPVVKFYLENSGVTVRDERIVKVIAMATDKLLSEIIYDSKQLSLIKQNHVTNKKRRQEMADTLELTDLESSLAQYGIFLKKNRKGKLN